MNKKIFEYKYIICVALILLFLIGWRSQAHTQNERPDSLINATAKGSWFPGPETRLMVGSADVWRSPFVGDEEQNPGVIDPISERTFYMLKTGSEVMWKRVPVHLETTFKRFPYHQIYSDSSGTIGNETVVDVIEMVPDAIVSAWLPGYRKQQQQTEEGWGWAGDEIRRRETSEGWQSDKFKNVPMMLHAFRNAPKHIDWFVFADDDTYIHSQSLGAILRGLDPHKPYYIGSAALIRDTIAQHGTVGESLKAAKPNDPVSLWFGHGGSGYLVSRGAVEALFWDPQREDDTVKKYSEWAVHTCCGDALFGFMLREELELYLNDNGKMNFEIDPFQGQNMAYTELSAAAGGWCSPIATWHHIKPFEVQKLYEWEESLIHRKSSIEDGVLFSDVYHDFILPFMEPVHHYWDNGASSGLYPEGSTLTVGGDEGSNDPDSYVLHPAADYSECEKACSVNPQCLGWKHTFLAGNSTCALEYEYIRMGKGTMPISHSEYTQVLSVSGWMIDRIRAIRSGEVCDPLEYNFESESYNDAHHEREGWYFRALAEETKEQLSDSDLWEDEFDYDL